MARKGNNIYLRNTGKWEGRYIRERMADGRIRYGYVSGSTYEEALKRRNEAADIYAKSTKEKILSERQLLFSSVSQDWLNERKSFLKESSIAKYRNILNWYLLPEFKDRCITEITKEELVSIFLLTGRDSRKPLGVYGFKSESMCQIAVRSIRQTAIMAFL